MADQDMAEPSPPARPRSRRRTGRIVFWVAFAVAAACLAASYPLGRASLRIYDVPPGRLAMENTIEPGDQLFVVPGAGFRRGDVVIVCRPVGSGACDTYVRRVIGLPGDRVDCCDASGRVTVDGRPLAESYLYPGDRPSDSPFIVTLGKGQIWVLGDHRSISLDSRAWGPLAVADVVGWVAAIRRGGSLHFLSTPHAFVAAGLAPVDNRTPSFVWLAVVSALAAVTLAGLTIFGIIRAAMRRRRRRKRSEPGNYGAPSPPSPSR